MNQKFDNILSRQGNGSMKWEEAYIQKRFHIDDMSDVIPLFIADMDFPIDDHIQKALQELCQQPDFGYFHIQESFFESIIHWYQNIHHINIQKEWISPSIGTITSLHLACDMLARNQGVVIMPPIYGPFSNCSQLGKTIEVPLLYQDQRYYIDFVNLEKTFATQSVRVLMLCHPHNPGGRMWSKEELLQLVLLCKQYKIVILVDEIHSDIQLTNKEFVSMIEFEDQYDQIIVSTSPNKTFNISGLSTSFLLCASQELRQQYLQYFNRLHLGCNRIGIKMIEYVYTYGEDWYHELLAYLQKNVQFVVEKLKETNAIVMQPDCGFLVWVQLPNIQNVDQFVLDFAKETHVLVETGSRFVSHYEGFIRINVATSYALLQEAMNRFVAYYQKYQ